MSAVERDFSQQVNLLKTGDSLRQTVSALVDGELTAAELQSLFQSGETPDEWLADWQTYQLIGDVLRGSESVPVASSVASRSFVAGVSARLQAELPSTLPQVAPVALVRGNAANDSVFRWKLLAGVASLAAVAAVGWSLVGQGAGVQAPVGPQMAAATPAPAVAEPPQSQPVVVQTPQGSMVRDARLEELLAEHRQFGGMSALQMPAGFLRNATYDAAPQR